MWRASVRAEAAVNKGQVAAVATQDMRAFFQSIDHSLLIKRAEEQGFPLELVRLAIDAYCAPRWLYTKAAIAEPVEPNCGIAPGCALATTMVKL